jgi:hypothetical protein
MITHNNGGVMDYSVIRIKDAEGVWYTVYEGTGCSPRFRDFVEDYASLECKKHGWDYCEVYWVVGEFQFQPTQFIVNYEDTYEYEYDGRHDAKDDDYDDDDDGFDVDYTPDHLLMY